VLHALHFLAGGLHFHFVYGLAVPISAHHADLLLKSAVHVAPSTTPNLLSILLSTNMILNLASKPLLVVFFISLTYHI